MARMGNIYTFSGDGGGKTYQLESELSFKLSELIHEYDGKLSAVAVIGILDLVKSTVLHDLNNS